jgi:hypothetical protein
MIHTQKVEPFVEAGATMREISPAVGMSADEYLRLMPGLDTVVAEIRRQKQRGERQWPSSSFIDRSTLLTSEIRERLIDKVAALVDENLFGRSDMCVQFAKLLDRALTHFNLKSRIVLGTATYYDAAGRETFQWDHAWVRVGREVIDGNVDGLFENPMVPDEVHIAPYRGPINETPADRRLREQSNAPVPTDEDVDNTWWPELKTWLDDMSAAAS